MGRKKKIIPDIEADIEATNKLVEEEAEELAQIENKKKKRGSTQIDSKEPFYYPEDDGLRFVVDLASEKDPNHFFGFLETASESEAKKSCIQKSLETGRECGILDRQNHSIFFKAKAGVELTENETLLFKKSRKNSRSEDN